MNNIRIGKDIAISWTITTNGVEESLAGRDLRLVIRTPMRERVEMEFSIQGANNNEVYAVFRGVDQKVTGIYSLTLWENFGKDGQTVVDYCDAFALVGTTCEETRSEPNNITTETVDLGTGNLEVFTGDGGSAADAPKDGWYYGRRNGDWDKVVGSEAIQKMVVLTQQEYDDMSAHDENTLYIIR